jgi:uncharacterized RDD family membrane protein YckC
MYTILGGDGKEYGPVPADQIRAWIAGGRANLDTKAKFLGVDEWKRLADFPEFLTGTPPPLAAAESDPHLAERLLRFGAWLADTAVAFVLCLPGMLMIGFQSLQKIAEGQLTEDAATPEINTGVLLLAAALLVLLVVQVWLLTTRGQTIGKRIMKIRIVRFRDGAPPGFVHAVLLRACVTSFLSIIPVFGPCFALADVLFIFAPGRRCIHDLIADTKVVSD